MLQLISFCSILRYVAFGAFGTNYDLMRLEKKHMTIGCIKVSDMKTLVDC